MKKVFYILIIVFFIGEATFASSIRQLPNTRFQADMDFNGAKLSDTLAILSKVTPATIVADSEVKDILVDLYINRGQTLREVIDVIKVTNNLEEVYVGNIVMLATPGKGTTTLMGKVIDEKRQGISGVRVRIDGNSYRPVQTQTGGVFLFENIRPGVYIATFEKSGYATSSEAIEVKQGKVTNLDLLMDRLNEEGKIVARSEDSLRQKDLGSSTDADGKEILTERIQLKHAFADDIKGVVDSVLEDGIVISSFPKLHMIVMKGDKDNMETARKLVDDLDRPVKQVRITAQVLDTTDNLFEDLGFNWLFSNRDSDIENAGSEGGSIGVLPVIAGTSSISNAINFVDIFNNGKNLLTASINLLQNTEDLSISSVPSIVIVNGEPAEFRVTEEVIVGEREDTDDDGNSTSQPLFEEAGTIFQVIPTIREGLDEPDTIILEISSEVSDFKLAAEGTFNDKGGSKIQSNISTKIQVKDGEVIFIGGLKKTTVKENVAKFPLLGDIPFLGTLFRNTSTTNNIRQVYIQITAEVVNENNKNNEIELDRFKQNPATTGKLKRIYPNFDDQFEGEYN